ncbi:hydantoinase B/oxoprolinase family protein, partial [Streptomyces sp. SID8382]
ADAAAGASAPRRAADGWYCPASGALISTGDDWRQDAIVTTRVAADRLGEYGVRVRPRDHGQRVLLEEFYSPRCGTLLDARIRVEAATAG